MKYKLSFFEILMICVGNIIGTGIFLVPATAAGLMGPGSLLLWILAALLSIIMGLCFAELSSMFSRSGGPMIFVKTAFGDFAGFISGWTTWTLSCITISSLAIAIPYYISFLFSLNFFERTCISLLIIFIFSIVNYIGIKFSARTQICLTLMTLAIFLVFIGIGLPHIEIKNFQPLFPLGLGALGIALAFTIEPFMGWEASTIIAEEVREPRKYIPKALAAAIIIIAIIYVLTVFVSLGTISWSVLAASPAPLAQAASFSAGFSLFMVIAAIFVNAACLNAWTLTTARLPPAMAKQKLFLDYFAKLSSRGTPTRAIALQAIFASAIVFVGSYEGSILLLLSNALILYILNFLSNIKLKQKISDIRFKIPIVFPIASIVFSVFLLTQINPFVLLSGLAIIFLGVPAYVFIKLTSDIKFIENFYDRISFIFDFSFKLWYGRKEIEKVLKNAELQKGSVVLDYGCGTGITTMEVAKLVKNVVAVDISKKQIKKAIKKTKKLARENVIFVKTSSLKKFDTGSFDRIICVVTIDHFVKPEKELEELARVLKNGGVASFLAFGKSLGMMPQKFLRHDNTIKNLFERAGFRKISIERVKKMLAEYIYVKAIK